jgi:hypothetical protein
MKRYAPGFGPILIISISVLLLVSDCTPFKPALYERRTTGLDFSKYQRSGFFVSPGDYFQNYQSISILRVTCFDGYMKKESPDVKRSDIWKSEDALYSEPPSNFRKKDYEFKSCKLSEILDYMVESATKLGANGITRLEIKEITQNSPVNGNVQTGILMTGLAISIKKPE